MALKKKTGLPLPPHVHASTLHSEQACAYREGRRPGFEVECVHIMVLLVLATSGAVHLKGTMPPPER